MDFKAFHHGVFFYSIRGLPHSCPSIDPVPSCLYWKPCVCLLQCTDCPGSPLYPQTPSPHLHLKKDVMQHLLSSLTLLASVSLRHLPSRLMQCDKTAGNSYRRINQLCSFNCLHDQTTFYKGEGLNNGFVKSLTKSRTTISVPPKSYSLGT